MRLDVLVVGLSDNFIHVLEQGIPFLRIKKADHYINAMGFLHNGMYNLIFCKNSFLGLSPSKFLVIVQEISPNSKVILFSESIDDESEIKYLTKGFEQVIDINRDSKLICIYLSKVISTTLHDNAVVTANKLILISEFDRTINYNSKEIKLTNIEFVLLKYLIEKGNVVSTRDELFALIQNLETPTSSQIQIIDVYIYRLRKKIDVEVIDNVYGEGFKIGSIF